MSETDLVDPRLYDIVSALREREQQWMAMRTRHAHITALVSNQWDTVFPDDEADVTEPMVRNLFRYTIEDGARLFADAWPSERVPAASGKDRAEDREIVLNGYTQRSGAWDVLEYHGQDMIAAGFTAIKTWPQFGLPTSERFPTFRRLDPRKVLPEPRWAPDKPTDNVIVHYTETVDRLMRQFPEQVQALMESIVVKQNKSRAEDLARAGYDVTRLAEMPQATPAELECVDWYGSAYVARAAIYRDDDRGLEEAIVLSMRDNETKICPVQLAHRPTWALEPMGDLDDVKGIVRTRNRYMRLLLDYFIEMVYGGKLAWNVRNPHERGPGTVYFGLGPDAKMESVTPNVPSFQALQVLQMMDHEGRTPTSPVAREGELDLNKATAAYLSRAQGTLSTVVRSLQRNYDVAKRHANEAAFAQDEAWCDTRKKIFGIARGRRFELEYQPSKTIKGDYGNIVTHGSASGVDAPTNQILINQKVQLRMLSIESALEQDPTIDDAGFELARIAEGRIRDSVIDGLALPTTPLEQRAAAWRALREAEDLDTALDGIVAAAAAPPALGPGAPPALPAPGAPPGIAGAEQPLPLAPLDSLRRVPGRR